MASEKTELHFVFFPLMAPGHMIPMVDIAKLIANRGLCVSIITTPHNASRFQSSISRSKQSGLNIHLLQLDFPSQQSIFPKDCENIDSLPSLSLGYEFFASLNLLKEPAEELLEKLNPKPSCIISDCMLPFTIDIARKLQIPRISFAGCNCLMYMFLENLKLFANLDLGKMDESAPVQDKSTENNPLILIPGFHDRIEITKAQLPKLMPSKLEYYQNQIMEAERDSYGIIVNSFQELEPKYAEDFKNKSAEKRVWCVGPVSLCNNDELDKSERGNKPSSIHQNECLKLKIWLDSCKPNSVIYACLGSICNLIPTQLIELGMGLESTNKPFIWVIRKEPRFIELDKWIQESGFESKIKGRGVLIRGWAPQVLILSHPSIGGFLTHCGWNSTLEGICAGVPMVTWPLFADQIMNEKLVVQILKIAVRVGVELPVNWGEEEEIGVLVKREDVKKALDDLMDEFGEEARERRKCVKQLADMAKRAVREGGSSYLNITNLIQDIKQQAFSST